ncbi:MAG TPA: TetR/AcrR family transcriptional regulator [Acidimicrobiia bacterium]|nr:TetR/AcrR family transcriptional regulator [Acidimicrobiia bacterium]
MAATSGLRKGRKGEVTRRLILERAAPVFNKRGYAGTSMSEVVEATGLEKGGIYNHFGSKDELAVEAFAYSISLMVDAFAVAQEGKVGLDRLLGIIEAFGGWADDPLIAGGCPIMNTAIESDDTHPALAARARDAMDSWHRLIGSIVKEAKARGEIDPDVDPYQLATLVTSTLEGSLMLSKLFHDPMHEQRAVASLTSHVESLRRTRGRGKGRANR